MPRVEVGPDAVPGSASRLAGLMDDVAATHARLEDALYEAAAARQEAGAVLGSRFWRLTATIRRWRARR